MTDAPKTDRVKLLGLWLTVCIGLLVLTLLDRELWRLTKLAPEVFERVKGKDLYQVLRQCGYLPTWLIAGTIVALAERSRGVVDWWRRGATIALAAFTGGLAAEIMKVVVMRQRPGDDGLYWFSWMNEGFSKGPGHGMPSSHAAVAFGAAFLIARQWPAAGWIAIPLAVGCGATRMLAGAHYATDVYVAAILGWAASGLALRLLRSKRVVQTVAG